MRDLLLIFTRALLLALVTILALEIALQFAFPLLPPDLTEAMPQYLERLGYRLNTDHGALEYPARQRVTYQVTPLTGDLYDLSCIKPSDAQAFEPYQVTFERDERGFRNAEPWPDDADLAVIGDSFTAAELIQRPFWQNLADSMLVLAVPGTGTLEQQRLFEAFALPRRPETIVLAFCGGNDLNDTRFFADMQRAGLTRQAIAHRGKTALDYSVVFRLLQFLSEVAAPDAAAECHYPVAAQTDPPTPVAFFRQFLPLLSRDKASLLESEELRLTKTSLSEMASALDATGGAFILMYIPQKAELYWRRLDAESKEAIIAADSRDGQFDGLDKIDENLSVQRDVMREIADELDIAFLDLTPALSEAIDRGSKPYFFADTHWNQEGHNIARNALLDFMNRSNLEK